MSRPRTLAAAAVALAVCATPAGAASPMLPFPDDRFTVAADTSTGRRVALPQDQVARRARVQRRQVGDRRSGTRAGRPRRRPATCRREEGQAEGRVPASRRDGDRRVRRALRGLIPTTSARARPLPLPSASDEWSYRSSIVVPRRPSAASRSLKSCGLVAARMASSTVDAAGLDVVEERLVEGLHAVVGALGDDLGQPAGLRGVDDHVPDAAGHAQDLAGGDAAAVVRAHEALGDDALERAGEHRAHLLVHVRREEVDDAVDRLGGVDGVDGREDEVAGLGRAQRGVDRLLVAHLADEDDVRVLAQDAAQRALERVRCPGRPRAG